MKGKDTKGYPYRGYLPTTRPRTTVLNLKFRFTVEIFLASSLLVLRIGLILEYPASHSTPESCFRSPALSTNHVYSSFLERATDMKWQD